MFKNYFSQVKAIPKHIWMLFFATTINRFGTMALPFLALYLTQKMHFTTVHAGWVLSIYGFGSLFASILSGILSDKYNPIRIMVVSLISTALVLICYPFFETVWVIYLCTLLFSLSNEIFRPALFTAISQFSEKENAKTYFAFIRLGINLGMSVGPALGGFLATVSYSLIFVFDSLTSFIAGLFLLKAYKQNKFPTAQKVETEITNKVKEPFWEGFIKAVSDKKLLWVCFAMLPVAIIFHQSEGAMPLYLVQALHFPESFYGTLFTVNTIIIVFLELPMYLKYKHIPERFFLVLGALGTALGFGLMSVAETKFAIIGTVILWTFGEMFFFPTITAVVTKMSPEKLKGSYMGVLTFSFNLTVILSPLIGTGLYQYYGPKTLWAFCGVIGLIPVVIYWFKKELTE